ncbi:MAG: HAD-IIIA family hydrolase [Candidatus Aenigmarchaeota archaeon]|nr:HAD-IIIA family hydrolase [Candidatus Aenigmarchaeota archaeon]
MNVFVGIDRDGTIIKDTGNRQYLGRSEGWENEIEFLPGVTTGIKALRKIQGIKIYMISNQTGIGIADFSDLTEERAHDVCKEILKRLDKEGAALDDYLFCPHISKHYITKHPERKFDPAYVRECDCAKPNPGMLFAAMKKDGMAKGKAHIYMIGDRDSDVETGLNAGGIGILVPSESQPGHDKKVLAMKNPSAFVAKNFEDAANLILNRESLSAGRVPE